MFLVSDQSLPDHLPSCSTLRTLFTRHLDVAAIPRRSFFALLRQFTQDDLEKEKLDEFLSNEGAVSDRILMTTSRVMKLMIKITGRIVRVLLSPSSNDSRST